METWTEYGVKFSDGSVRTRRNYTSAKAAAEALNLREEYGHNDFTIVGRQVTASDWLPVDQDGAA